MMSDNNQKSIEVTLVFQRNLRKLKKKYRNIKNDVQAVITKLQKGDLLGDQIPNIDYQVYKLRIKNSDNKKGKSGGYRLIYYLKTEKSIILLTIYSKSEQVNITNKQIIDIIDRYNQ